MTENGNKVIRQDIAVQNALDALKLAIEMINANHQHFPAANEKMQIRREEQIRLIYEHRSLLRTNLLANLGDVVEIAKAKGDFL